jgi:linoleoyl-CoA desaturase
MTNHPSVKFNPREGKEFYSTLRKRVNNYFKENEISKFGNTEMYLKTVFMIALYTAPYILMVIGVISSPWLMLSMTALMGLGQAGVGLTVMHDANHGSYSKNRRVNKIMSYTLNGLGGNTFNWQVQHNVLHHTFTNIQGMDEDIETVPILRFSPHTRLMKVHKFQWLYAWFFYGLMTLMWSLSKDFTQLVSFKKKGLLESQNTSFWKELRVILLSKVLYYFFVLVVPMLTMEITFWQWLLGFVVMQFISGLGLALIFQPAHVLEDTQYPLPDGEGNIDNNFAIHQLQTTANFANNSRVFGWLVGGLNHQIEHHLFPNICHVHYRKISKIVKETSQEYGLPYHQKKTFMHALLSHGKMLYKLGRIKTAA